MKSIDRRTEKNVTPQMTVGTERLAVQSYSDATEILKKARREACAAIDIANETTHSLARQGEQIDRIDENLDCIEYELKVSDRIVRSMESWGGMIASWFKPKPKPPKPQEPPKRSVDGAQTNEGRPQGVVAVGGKGARHPRVVSAVSSSSAPATGGVGGPYFQEHDALLDGLSHDLTTLKEQAHVQREVIAEQTQKLDAIDGKTDKVQWHMKRTEKKIKRML
jgi:hypothetical protein